MTSVFYRYLLSLKNSPTLDLDTMLSPYTNFLIKKIIISSTKTVSNVPNVLKNGLPLDDIMTGMSHDIGKFNCDTYINSTVFFPSLSQPFIFKRLYCHLSQLNWLMSYYVT